MPRSFIFWAIMLLWALAILGAIWGPRDYTPYFHTGGTVLHFILFGLLGWQVYGPAIKG